MSTKVGLFFAAAFPPGPISGKPGRVRSYASETLMSTQLQTFAPFTFDNLSSDKTLQISLYLTTSHGWLPSQSSTFDTGSVVRSLAYSAGGSAAVRRVKGNLGGPDVSIRVLAAHFTSIAQGYTDQQ